jgi:hypothetical protein
MTERLDGGIFGAVRWVEQLMLGTVATSAMVMAVSILGLMALDGRLDRKLAVRIILGCFVIVGAPTIVAGIMMTAGGDNGRIVTLNREEDVSPPPPRPPERFDPYGGASVPAT